MTCKHAVAVPDSKGGDYTNIAKRQRWMYMRKPENANAMAHQPSPGGFFKRVVISTSPKSACRSAEASN